MKKLMRNIQFACLFAFGTSAACAAQADVAISNGTINAAVSSVANLTLGGSNLTFANSNPTTTPSIPANENGITVTVNGRTSVAGSVILTVLAGGDLTSGAQTIPIGNVTWTAAGTGFQAGTLSKTTAGIAASFVGSGTHSGTLNFFLANSYAYVTGTYTATITYTLTAL